MARCSWPSFQETRTSRVVLHEDNWPALRWLIKSIKGENPKYEMDDMLPRREFGTMYIPADGTTQEMLSAYALVLKYDCPKFMHYVVDGLAASFRFLSEDDEYYGDDYMAFVKEHIDFVIDLNNGRYPIDLAPAIGEAWSCMPYRFKNGESMVVPLMEGQPDLAVAVARYYQERLDRVSYKVQVVSEALRGQYFED